MSRLTRPATLLASTVLAAGLATVGGSVASPAGAVPPECSKVITKVHSTKGSPVWIPSDKSAGPFQYGGTQSRSSADGTIKASTKGSSDQVGGDGGVSFGPIKASASYNHQWNRSTTTSDSKTSTFTTTSPSMPNSVHWRWKLYLQGVMYTSNVTQTRPQGCPNPYTRRGQFRNVMPLNNGASSYQVERFAHRGQVHDNQGKPVGF